MVHCYSAPVVHSYCALDKQEDIVKVSGTQVGMIVTQVNWMPSMTFSFLAPTNSFSPMLADIYLHAIIWKGASDPN